MKFFIILISIKFILNYCNNRSEPIFLSKTNTCAMQYCSEEDIKKNNCIIDKDIIRTQWLNNIVKFGS
jgi:hypothetical protein